MNTPKDKQSKENECLDTSISFQAVADLPWQPSNLGEYRQLSLWKSIPTHSLSCDRISQEYQFIPISETTTQSQENSICYRWDFLAQAQATQEAEQDYLTQSQHFGERDLDVLSRLNPASVLSNSLKELSDEDFELFLADSVWQDIVLKLKQSRQQSLGRVINDSDYLSFPTLTSGASSMTSRPAGQTKCEKWFKDKGLIPNGSQLGTQAIALTMGFPSNWFIKLSDASEGLKEQYSNKTIIPSQVKHQDASEQDISQDEQLHQDKQRSPSVESSICIPCLVKQPNQDEVKGVIKQDLGDRFLVDISDELITVSKLFVYPDFSASVGQIEKNPRKNLTPSICEAVSFRTNNPRKNRRRKNGQGNGSIYYRTVTKNGRQYQEAYYHYVENGKKRTKYIPRKLLDRVSEAESRSLPVADILFLLGGDEKNPRKSSITLSTSIGEKLNDACIEQVLETDSLNPRKTTPPSKRRKQGFGTGYIECKPIKRSGKEYKQYWYHYEEWRSGDRLLKKSKYIPKRLVKKVERMNNEKASVDEILKVLRRRKKQG